VEEDDIRCEAIGRTEGSNWSTKEDERRWRLEEKGRRMLMGEGVTRPTN
jgi:hypothetical protein